MRRVVIRGTAWTLLFALLFAGGAAQAQETLLLRAPQFGAGPAALHGAKDYVALLNGRDGGIGGVALELIDCADRQSCTSDGRKPLVLFPSPVEHAGMRVVAGIPVLALGHGRPAIADGRVFEWYFNAPASAASQASALIGHLARASGGRQRLKGRKLAHLHLNTPYGKAANRTLEALARQYGLDFKALAVQPPGGEQRAVWREVGRFKPDFIYLSGWGEMTRVALAGAAELDFPMDRLIGNLWSASADDVRPADRAALGYTTATFHSAGPWGRLHDDIRRHVYDKGQGAAEDAAGIGGVAYNRAIFALAIVVEAIRRAQDRIATPGVSARDVRWGLENTDISAERWSEIGLVGLAPLRLGCRDHEGASPVLFQQWDARVGEWKIVSDWTPVMPEVPRAEAGTDAAAFARSEGITPRACEAGR